MQQDSYTLKDWRAVLYALDPNVRYKLLLGACNKQHLLSIAYAIAQDFKNRAAPVHGLRTVGLDCLLAALEEDPLDSSVVKAVLALDNQCGHLAPQALEFLRRLDGWLDLNARLTPQTKDILRAHGLGRLAGGAKQLRLHELFARLINDQALPAAFAVLAALQQAGLFDNAAELELLRQKLLGDLCFFNQNLDTALECYTQLYAVVPDIVLQRHVQTLLLLGERDKAVEVLSREVRRRPWRTNALLKLYDLAQGHDQKRASVQDTSILLYTYNHAAYLNDTLESLSQSTAAGCAVFVLLNGCTDATASVMDSWASSGAFPKLHSVPLPVNVGAPAARNWLLSLPEVMANPYVCYLDDDVVLPKDWLERLYYSRQVYPNAGVWGAKVREHESEYILQQVDLNLFPPEKPDGSITFADLQLMLPDAGQFDYMRPATSVTGCCHLFKREVFETVGCFDVHFSPTQYDDLDHSMRMVQAGVRSVYTGHLAVDHRRVSGGAVTKNRLSHFNALGNFQKLHGKYTRSDWKKIADAMHAVLLEDYLHKAGQLLV